MEAEADAGGVSRFAHMVSRIARGMKRRLPHWADVDDMQSVAMMALIEAGCQDEPLARRIAMCSMIDYARMERVRHRDRAELLPAESMEGRDAADAFDDGPRRSISFGPSETELYSGLRVAIKQLSPRHYEAITLVYWLGYGQSEAAEIIGVSEASFSELISRAQDSLKKLLIDPKFMDSSNDYIDRGVKAA